LTGFDGAEHLAGVPTTRDAIDLAAYATRVDTDYAAACEAGIACALPFELAGRHRLRFARDDRALRPLRAPVLYSPVPGDAGGASVATLRREPWDMLTGRLEPQLGGHSRYVNLLGVHCHQGHRGWRGTVERAGENGSGIGLARLLADVHARHALPIVVAETSAAAGSRVAWMRDFGRELCEAIESGIPVLGACLCRAVEQPAWEDPRLWRGRRLWDALLRNDVSQVPDSAYAQALRDVQSRVDSLLAPASRRYSS
jgi:hypothetical protein